MAGKTNLSKNDRRPVVIRREEAAQASHHGGAWKVAYADFVTAMMAFFLLMWLLNATTETQRKGLADYFSPSNILSHNSAGSGKPFGGVTPFEKGNEVSDKGTMAVMVGRAEAPETDPRTTTQADAATDPDSDQDGQDGTSGQNPEQGTLHPGGGQASRASVVPARADYLGQAASGSAKLPVAAATDPAHLDDASLHAELARREQAQFRQAAQSIRDAVAADPALASLGRQLAVDVTPEGLRIQLLDADSQPMFDTGSAALTERARLLVTKLAPVLAKLPQDVSIAGHTDAAPYRGTGRSNWDLSTDRALATRRLLEAAGLPEGRFRRISGEADREPLLPADPMAAVNRRIAITVLRAAAKP